jgi:hypothetical protein
MWEPAPEKQKELAYLLEATQQPGADHREVLDRLDLYKRSDAFNNHLAHLFAFGTEFSELVRSTVTECALNHRSSIRIAIDNLHNQNTMPARTEHNCFIQTV